MNASQDEKSKEKVSHLPLVFSKGHPTTVESMSAVSVGLVNIF